MPKRIEKKILPYTAVQLFNIAINVEAYPEFLPWCQATRITEKEKDFLVADMKIGYKELAEVYTSKILYNYPSDGIGEIKVSLLKGPFKHLYNYWHFKNINDHESEIIFEINFSFNSSTLNKLVNFVFDRAFEKVVIAFENRASSLYK